MQTSSARKFSLRSPRFDSTTGKRRGFWYSWRALAAGLALALLAGSGIAVAAVGSNADAHTPNITFTCQGIHVVATSYSGSDTNTVIVKIPVAGIDFTTTFTNSFDQFFAFPDSTKAWDFHAEIKTTATNPAYQQQKDGPSTPCVAPTISGGATACNTVNGTTALTAFFGQLVVGHTYTVKLDGPSGNISTQSAYAPASATIPTYSEPSWGAVAAGKTYTVTITDNTNKDLTKSTSIVSIGCPTTSTISITPTECSVDGGNASFTVTATSLIAQRTYRVDVYKDGVAQPQTPFVATGASYTSAAITATAGSSYYVTITDVDAGITSPQSAPVKFLPCPKAPSLTVDPTQCTATDGTPNSSISFSAANLVPGRTYQVTVSNGATNVFDSTPFVASASNWPTATPKQFLLVAPGKTYTVTVVDIALTNFVSHTSEPISECPKLPELSITPTQCSVPGGTGSIASTVSATSYIPGRTYNLGLTLVQGGGTVVAPAPVVAPASGVWTLPSFSNLAANTQYRVTLTDTVVTSVSAYGDVSLAVCPGMPSITLQATCKIIGASPVDVSLGKLEPGQTYTVNIVNASTNKNVGTATVPGTNPTATLQFLNVPNGASYVVSVANANNTLTGSATIFLKICDLPTLAFTGANPVGPAVAGIGFLQLGLMLVGFGLVKRRRRTA